MQHSLKSVGPSQPDHTKHPGMWQHSAPDRKPWPSITPRSFRAACSFWESAGLPEGKGGWDASGSG